MADEPTIEGLQGQIATLQAKVKEVSDEAKGHRLNADNYRKQSEDWRTQFTASREEIESVRKAQGDELERLRIDLTGRATAAEASAAQATEGARSRVMMADLRVAAREAGMLDMDGLKLLDTAQAKLGADGDVENAADLMTAMREAKPYLFGAAPKPGTVTGTTGAAALPPRAAPAAPPDVRSMTPADYAAARRDYVSGAAARR